MYMSKIEKTHLEELEERAEKLKAEIAKLEEELFYTNEMIAEELEQQLTS